MKGYLQFIAEDLATPHERVEKRYKKTEGDEHSIIKDKHGDTYTVIKRRHDPDGPSGIAHRWEVRHPRYGHVATATGTASPARPIIDTVQVSKRHQRKGIATALYKHIEHKSGVKLKNNAASKAGKAFRAKYDSDRG